MGSGLHRLDSEFDGPLAISRVVSILSAKLPEGLTIEALKCVNQGVAVLPNDSRRKSTKWAKMSARFCFYGGSALSGHPGTRTLCVSIFTILDVFIPMF